MAGATSWTRGTVRLTDLDDAGQMGIADRMVEPRASTAELFATTARVSVLGIKLAHPLRGRQR